jgi:glutathione peroxidase
MKVILIAILSGLLTTSIYSIPVTGADNTAINLTDFQAKKILIVNIATGSDRVSQLSKLQSIQEEYSDSLVVIAFPSNSFGNESRSNSDIIQFCQSGYGVTFRIASKADVTGQNRQALYQWLTDKLKNGVMNQEIKGDFQKYLIDGNGEIIAVFSGSAEPDHPGLIQAIEN